MTYPEKKSKITKKMMNQMSLPNDLLLNCLARVSRQYHPTLSLVSKSFRSLIASPELYKARSLLDCTESCLYVCIQLDNHCRYFTLLLKTIQSHTESSGYFLATLPIPPFRHTDVLGLVAIGSNIYHIHDEQSSLSILDCPSHTWREGPSFRVKLAPIYWTNVLDRKIYVAGRNSGSFKRTIEVFNTETQIWDPPYEGSWDLVRPVIRAESIVRNNYCECEIEKVLYSADSDGFIRWYDTEVSKWENVLGLGEVFLKLVPCVSITFADYGGKMAFFGFKGNSYTCKRKTWCAVIALERRTGCEIWGRVEWFDHVLTLPSSAFAYVIKVIVATL